MTDDNKAANETASLLERLKIREYRKGDFAAAIRGERLPHAMGLRLSRLCIIRGSATTLVLRRSCAAHATSSRML